MLSEAQERRAFSMLRNRWPVPREYMLYRLREHTHEDIPYRWFELLVEAEETRAVDLILEELLVHGGIPEYREDLTAVLGLIEGSRDPGRIGKIVRLLSFESVSRERLGLLEEWLATSSLAGPVGEAVEARKAGRRVLVPRDQDLAAFVAHGGEAGGEDLWDEWREAYHESLGWQRHADFPQGPAREAFEQELRSTMVRSARLTRDEALLRDRIEAFEEEWLMNSHTGPPSLARIHRESPRNPWMDEVRNFDLNSWYIRAAQAFDEGRSDRARRYLDVLLGIDAGYPLATALDRVLNRQERDGESNVSGR
jgi:hypothetical protein